MGIAAESWQRNLYAIFVAEFVVLTGFNFSNPFLPLFIQDLGNFTDTEAALWAGIATGASGVVMFFSAPLWGIVADRWGRKPMVLRAMFGSSIVLALTGLAPNIYYLIALRAVQGLLSGTLAAASALVAAFAPRNKMSFAMGLLALAMFGGQTFGPLLGGILADVAGYRATFFIIGALVFLGGLIVLFFVREEFQQQPQTTSLGRVWRLSRSGAILPLLIVFGASHIGTQMVAPIVPLFVRQLDPQVAAATTAGLAFSFMGAIAAISSLVTGRLGERVSLKGMLALSCLGTGLLYLPPMFSGTVTQLVIFITLTGLLRGGLMTSSSALVGLSVPLSQQGIAYGLAQSANALGNGLGPLIGGSLASLMGLRPVFGVTGALFVLVGVLITKLLPKEPLKEV